MLIYFRGDTPHDSDLGDCPEPSFARTGGSGLAVGAMTGFFGVGGGFLIVPALTTLLGLSMRRAIATSLAIITLTGLAALVSYLAEGARPDWPLRRAVAGGKGRWAATPREEALAGRSRSGARDSLQRALQQVGWKTALQAS